ncbi:MAG: GNAT family N-acetyltransferase [Pseudomonadota bacterium]
MTPEIRKLLAATWPPAKTWDRGGWTLRDGAGGGSRVSAATWSGSGAPDIAKLSAEMDVPLVMVRAGEEELDEALDQAGFSVMDPTIAMAVEPGALAAMPPSVTSFDIWPPLAIQTELWADAGIGSERLAIMERAQGHKTTLFGRIADRPAGVAYLACHDGGAMLHALEVAPEFRRRGLARIMMQHAAHWALEAGANPLTLLVTRANTAAIALYTSLGFQVVGHYHYRIKPTKAVS